MSPSELLNHAAQLARSARELISGDVGTTVARYLEAAEAVRQMIDRLRPIFVGDDRAQLDLSRGELDAAIDRVNKHFDQTLSNLVGKD